jgi:hypothetical protein
MTKKIIKREGVVYITPDGKIASIQLAVSDIYAGFSRGCLGGHIDNEPMQLPVMREPKEDRNVCSSR